MECEPEIIFMAGRMSEYYDSLSEIAPVVRLTSDSELGLVESVRKNAKTIASIFGLEDEVDEKMAAFDERIDTLSEFASALQLPQEIFSLIEVLNNSLFCSATAIFSLKTFCL